MPMTVGYKVGQGKQARSTAKILLLLIAGWGCYAFFEYGNTKLDRLLGFGTPWFGRPLPFFDPTSSLTSWITPSFVLCLGLFVVFFVWIRKYLNRPKIADHLIGTELEMRRVKWPEKQEVWKAGSIVVYYVIWLSLIIFVLDLFMATTIGMLLGSDFSEVGIGRIFSGLGSYLGLSN